MMKGSSVDLQRGAPGHAGRSCPSIDKAVATFLKRFEGAMQWCINLHSIPQHERADVAQEVRIMVLRNWRRHGAIESEVSAGYIYAITRNACLKYYEQRKRIPLAAEGAAEQLQGTELPQDEWLDQQQAHKRLHMAVATLPPMSRAIMRHVLLGKELRAFAAEYDISMPNTKVIAHRARTLLRKRLVNP